MNDLKRLIRDVPDFPKKGILFRDITPLLGDPRAFGKVVDQIAARLERRGINRVAAIEARGYIFAAPVALRIGAGFVPIRKPGKLPWKALKETYALEYGTGTLEMHEDAVKPGERVAIIDDLLATGGTALAAANLVEKAGGKVAEFVFAIELDFLTGRAKLEPRAPVFTLVRY